MMKTEKVVVVFLFAIDLSITKFDQTKNSISFRVPVYNQIFV